MQTILQDTPNLMLEKVGISEKHIRGPINFGALPANGSPGKLAG